MAQSVDEKVSRFPTKRSKSSPKPSYSNSFIILTLRNTAQLKSDYTCYKLFGVDVFLDWWEFFLEGDRPPIYLYSYILIYS